VGRIPLSEIDEGEAEPEPTTPVAGEIESNGGAQAPRIVYLDLETQKTAEDVGGWRNTHLMRISVAVVYDSVEERFRVFEEREIEALIEHLKKAALIVGFNIKRFDYRVLSAYCKNDLNRLPTFDIMEEITKSLGFRLSLDHLAQETLGAGKTADGLQAVEWFKQGDMEKLTEYCTHDVAVTKDLFQFGLKNGHLIYRKKEVNRRLRLLVDWNLNHLIKPAQK
jgi:DEAD/DEAH box helicase domain-containing protein